MADIERRNSWEKMFVAATVAVLFVIVVFFVVLNMDKPEEEDPGSNDNGPWKDLEKMRASISGVQAFNFKEIGSSSALDRVSSPDDTVYLLIGIEKKLNSSDYISIRDFIYRGGFAIIADDGTNANRIGDIPASSGGQIEYIGKRYLVDRSDIKPWEDPGWIDNKTFILSRTSVGDSDFDLVLHEPKGLNYTEPGNPLLTSTKELTVVDMDQDWVMEPDDLYKPYGPFGIEFAVGNNGGGLLYVSTTGLFTDNVFGEYDNEEWLLSYLSQFIPKGGDVLLDTGKQANSYSPHLVLIPS